MIKSYLEDMQGKDTQDIIKDILLQKLIDLHKLDITDMVILETMPSNTLLIALIINKASEQEHIELVAYMKRHRDFTKLETNTVYRKAYSLLTLQYTDLQSTYFDAIYFDFL